MPATGATSREAAAAHLSREGKASMEKRLLLAFVLSAAILLVWSVLFPPPAPVRAPEQPASERDDAAVETATEPRAADAEERPQRTENPTGLGEEAIGASEEQQIELANETLAVRLTNRGAAVASYELIGYDDDEGRPVDLIQDVPLDDRTLPLQLLTEGGPDNVLYEVTREDGAVVFRWADGRGNATEKRVSLSAEGYGLDVRVTSSGARVGVPVSIGTGLRNLGEVERNSRLALWGEGIMVSDGDVEHFKRRKIKAPLEVAPSAVSLVGFEGAYFLGILRPQNGLEKVRIEPLEFTGDDDETNTVLRISVVPAGSTLSGQYLGAPKEYDLLQTIGGGVERTLDFGLFGPISVFFLKALRWIYSHVGNYGLAIILLTLGIRILLFPLMHTSTVSMRKMAKIQPKAKEIQAKYKKKKTDPQARAKMNQEMMALYKQEGVNPMAGCLPLLIQLPLLWALYQLFLKAIELRHAPFMLWITDLSAKDPLYVTPVLMTATMWLQQRLAPQAGDPQQQRLMRMMPLIFGIMFLQFPSGLVLYWLTNNVITIIQQEITLHLVGERSLGRFGKKGAGKK